MTRISRAERIELWLERIGRQRTAGKTISEFCSEERISAASFYQWKRRLSRSASDGKPQAELALAKAIPTHGAQSPPTFAEVQVVGQLPPASVLLSGGIRIQLGCDLELAGCIVDRVLQHSLGSNESEA